VTTKDLAIGQVVEAYARQRWRTARVTKLMRTRIRVEFTVHYGMVKREQTVTLDRVRVPAVQA